MWTLLQWLDPPLPTDIPAPARMLHSACDAFSGGAKNQFGDETAIRFEFVSGGDQSLSAADQARFRADFRRELTRLQAWLAQAQDWASPPRPAFQVRVSAGYKISRALVPAWDGHRGLMEFPAWRVRACKAAILHELTHVYLPNGNRSLAEGLATYLQALLGGNPAFPNFDRPLHRMARDCLIDMTPGFLSEKAQAGEGVRLAELDATPTPNPLTLEAARPRYEQERGFQAAIYAIVGSFVEFLIETRGLARFQRLYGLTPLVAGQLAAGAPARWSDIYGHALADLEAEWKSLIGGARCRGTPRGSARPRSLT